MTSADRPAARRVAGSEPGRTSDRQAARRITIPRRPAHHVDRPELVARCAPETRGVTVLAAPAGFGKTALLAACCRAAAAEGTPVAWLSVEAGDTPATLATALAAAFGRAGLEHAGSVAAGAGDVSPVARAMLMVSKVDAVGSCVLALDALERLVDRDAVAFLGAFLRAAPAGISIAMACRYFPPALDIAALLFDGDAVVLTAEDLRFSRAETARFFDTGLSRRQLAHVVKRSRGWPIVLHAFRFDPGVVRAGTPVARDIIFNWMAAELLYALTDEDRDLVLDAGLLDAFDRDFLAEVLDEPGAASRLDAIGAMAGLVDWVDDGATTRCLHPLVREYCVHKRRRDTPERFRTIHRRIAMAHAARARTVEAAESAMRAGDAELVGRILVEAGGLRLWLRDGARALSTVARWLTPEVVRAWPQLGLLHSVALVLQGRLDAARRAYAAAVANTRAVGDDTALEVDACLVRAMLCYSGCERVDSVESRLVRAETARIATLATVDPMSRAAMEFWNSVAHSMAGDFAAARDCAGRVRRLAAGTRENIAMLLDFQVGVVAMAQGRVEDAGLSLRRGRRAARTSFRHDPGGAAFADVLTRELAVERGRPAEAGEAVKDCRQVYARGTLLAPYAAAAEVAVELTLDGEGVETAVALLDGIQADAGRKSLPTVERVLSGLRVSLCVLADDVGEAECVWRADDLPTNDAACCDFGRLSWREVEALASARLRLLVANAHFDDARRLVARLFRSARARGLRRTAMRALALAVRLEHRAGENAAAVAHFETFLRLFAETDYARAMVREGEAAAATAERFLDANDASPLVDGAARLLAAARVTKPPPQLNERERQILGQLETRRDKQIAARLEMTPDGVRYHLRGLFRKLGVHTRTEAVREARRLGLLPPE